MQKFFNRQQNSDVPNLLLFSPCLPFCIHTPVSNFSIAAHLAIVDK